jgi:hypothetical protein
MRGRHGADWCTQVAAGTNARGTASSMCTGSSQTLDVDTSDSPAFPKYDPYMTLDTSGSYTVAARDLDHAARPADDVRGVEQPSLPIRDALECGGRRRRGGRDAGLRRPDGELRRGRDRNGRHERGGRASCRRTRTRARRARSRSGLGHVPRQRDAHRAASRAWPWSTARRRISTPPTTF